MTRHLTTLMTFFWIGLGLFPVVASDPRVEAAEKYAPGLQLSYRGSVFKKEDLEGEAEPEKQFDLTLFVVASSDQASQLLWIVDETGRGSWAWPERFGSFEIDAQGNADDSQTPALFYDRGDEVNVVPLITPLWAVDRKLADRKLAEGTTWTEGKHRYEVLRESTLDDEPAWQIEVSNNYGHQRMLWIAPDAPWMLGLDQRVFMGQGVEYLVQLRLVAVEQLGTVALDTLAEGYRGIAALRNGLNRPLRATDPKLSPRQLAEVKAKLPALQQAITSGPLLAIVQAADSDLKVQSQRAGDVASLVAKYQDQPAAPFSLKELQGRTVDLDDLKQQITVLHFWEYRDRPLTEPYGQIGYLDYLYGQRRKDGLKVYGVAVDGRLGDEQARAGAVRGVRKLKSFMNLSYPILLDSGQVLRQFGDPRRAGVRLPLFVVLDGQSRIIHYHVGTYEVDPDVGLKQLDEVVQAALKKAG
jgi:peroxiredoxin